MYDIIRLITHHSPPKDLALRRTLAPTPNWRQSARRTHRSPTRMRCVRPSTVEGRTSARRGTSQVRWHSTRWSRPVWTASWADWTVADSGSYTTNRCWARWPSSRLWNRRCSAPTWPPRPAQFARRAKSYCACVLNTNIYMRWMSACDLLYFDWVREVFTNI